MTVRNIPWVRWFNSFGFLTIIVFSFAVLTMLVFPSSEGNVNLSRMHALVQADSGQSPERFKTITTSRFRESTGTVYAVHGP
jgi:hypothetical protein